MLNAYQFVSDAWRKISSATVQKCFAYCGFKERTPDFVPSFDSVPLDVENIPELALVTNCAQFIAADDDAVCNEEWSDDVIDQIANNMNNPTDEDDDGTPPLRVTCHEARIHVERLRLFFMQEGVESGSFTLDACADFINTTTTKNMRQDTLDKYLGTLSIIF